MSVNNRPTTIGKALDGRTVFGEKVVEAELKAAVKAAGGFPVKMALAGSRGFPDELLIMPGGRTIYVECKTTGRKLDPLQVVWMYRLLDLGHEWYLLDHIDDIESIINPLP